MPARKEREFYRLPCSGSTFLCLKFSNISIACIIALQVRNSAQMSLTTPHSGIITTAMQVAKNSPVPISFDDIAALAMRDRQAVDQLIADSLESDVALVSQVSQYIVMSGGKRLRPLVVLLAARALGYEGENHVRAATIIEFIHTATLLHDDVVDSSSLRRGQDSANTVFGNQASVLVGDFLYSRAFQMMVGIGNMRIMQILADATNTIAAGEVMQLMNVHDPDTTEDDYQQVIYRKTARLFEAGSQIAAVLSGQSAAIETSMIDYGRHLGTAFQLVDDALDFDASADELGKNIGDDLAEGKATLPLIYAMQKGSPEDGKIIRNAILEGGLDQLDRITAIIKSTGALQYTADKAREAADLAIRSLAGVPDSEYKQALISIAELSIQRRS
jgi:octaprenyl-diphosphate synthase